MAAPVRPRSRSFATATGTALQAGGHRFDPGTLHRITKGFAAHGKTARELENVNLADALALTLLTAETGDDRWPRAAARWLGRFIVETPAITISGAGLAAAAIQELAGQHCEIAAEICDNLPHYMVTPESRCF